MENMGVYSNSPQLQLSFAALCRANGETALTMVRQTPTLSSMTIMYTVLRDQHLEKPPTRIPVDYDGFRQHCSISMEFVRGPTDCPYSDIFRLYPVSIYDLRQLIQNLCNQAIQRHTWCLCQREVGEEPARNYHFRAES